MAELDVDGELWATWDEAVEHASTSPAFDLAGPGEREVPFSLPAGREVEPLGAAGRVVRERWPVDGVVRVESEHCPGPVPADQAAGHGRERAPTGASRACRGRRSMRRSLVGVHMLLHADDAPFLSLLDPPEFARGAVDRVHERRRPSRC